MGFVVNCKNEITNYWNRSDATLAYFDDIKDYNVLSSTEERELMVTIKYGNDANERKKAREKLITHNQRFVASVARRFTNGSNLLDLINEANIGLITAIDKFDMSYKGRFLTYAVFWMRKSINDYLISKERSVQPINAHKIYAYANKARERFFNKEGRNPTEEELVTFLYNEYGVVISNKNDLAQYTINSIDMSITSDDDNEYENIGDFAISTATNNINEYIEQDNNKNIIQFLLRKLPERNREILCRYYGINREEESIDTISCNVGLGKERIRQIINESIESLKKIKIKDL